MLDSMYEGMNGCIIGLTLCLACIKALPLGCVPDTVCTLQGFGSSLNVQGCRNLVEVTQATWTLLRAALLLYHTDFVKQSLHKYTQSCNPKLYLLVGEAST